ncbi:Dph6-related ATP pyrophosphatase [Methylomagnum sp.]
MERLFKASECIDPRSLDPAFAGRDFDDGFLDELPEGVDPCGERGEFHSFAYDGPMFARPVPVQLGEVVTRDGFVFADLLHSPGYEVGHGGRIRVAVAWPENEVISLPCRS